MNDNQLHQSQDNRDDRPDPDARAEEYRQVRQELNNHQLDTWEHQQVRSSADRTYTRFVGDLHQVTKCQKLSPAYNISSGQIVQAIAETNAAVDIKVFKAVLKGNLSQNISHYSAFVRKKEMITACRVEAKGKIRRNKSDPSKKEIYFPEQPGDIPINPHNPDAPTILDGLSDKRSGNDVGRTDLLFDLELLCAGMTMRSRPDISLFDCFRLILDDYSMMDIARYFSPDNVTEQQLKGFYDLLDYWLKGKKVRSLLGSYLGGVILIYIALIMDSIDL